MIHSEEITHEQPFFDFEIIVLLILLLRSATVHCFQGHNADVLDLSWSKNNFLLSSGMDRTVKLWHITRTECLCCFQHVDFVTCVAFLPKDDRYFLSGSLDGKLRLWHIPDKKVAVWNEVQVALVSWILHYLWYGIVGFDKKLKTLMIREHCFEKRGTYPQDRV